MICQRSLASYAGNALLCRRTASLLAARNLSTRTSLASEAAPAKGKTPANPPRIYRSKHLDPDAEPKDKSKMKLLEPHALSMRLKKLCESSKVDDAVAMLKAAPLDAQNTQVWNTLMWECMKAQRFQLAFKLYTDMKRRGFSPSTRTYQTYFGGLARIEDWTTYTKQLSNARSVYDSYKRHIASVKAHDPESAELSIQPLTHYLTILGTVGLYQEMFDVYYAMDTEGPMSPDQFIYTAMFSALSRKPTSLANVPTSSFYLKSAENAKVLWRQLEKAVAKERVKVDSFIIGSAVAALARGKPTDQDLAFKIIADYHGLVPGQKSISASSVKIPITAPSLSSVFLLCSSAEKHNFILEIFEHIKTLPEDRGGPDILDRAHMEEIMRARHALPEHPSLDKSSKYCLQALEWMLRQEIVGQNGPRIRPAVSTYTAVMHACWRDADWSAAVRVFELMTGYHAHDFMDGSVAERPRLDKRGKGRTLDIKAEMMSAMLKVSMASRHKPNVRQCLRIISHLGPERLLLLKKTGGSGRETMRKTKNESFYAAKLASAILEAVDYISQAPAKTAEQHKELEKWDSLKKLAEAGQSNSPSKSKPRVPRRNP